MAPQAAYDPERASESSYSDNLRSVHDERDYDSEQSELESIHAFERVGTHAIYYGKDDDVRLNYPATSSQSKKPDDLQTLLKKRGLVQDKEDPNLLTWSDKWQSDRTHPRNRTAYRKAFDTSVILFAQLLMTSMASAGTSMGSFAKEHFGLTRTTSIVVFVLPYQLGRVVCGTAIPPFTETWGRKGVFIGSLWLYAIFCVISGVVPNVAAVVVGRAVCGGMSAVGGSVAAGSMQDIFDMKELVWAFYGWCAVSVGGLALGPIYGSYVSSEVSWQWVLYIAAIAAFGNGAALFFMRETRPSRLLEFATQQVRKITGNKDLKAKNPDSMPDFKTFAETAMIRPAYLLVTEPLVATTVFISSVAWSLLFLFTESLTVVYGLYGFSEVETSLFFIPVLIGVFLGIPVRFLDLKILYRREREGKALEPEDKLTGFSLGAPALAVGLWWFAWTTPQLVHTHWIVPSLALVPVGFAVNELDYTLAGYLVDAYPGYASSAVGSLMILRSTMAGIFPTFAYFMFTGIPTNAASSILAAMATLFCIAPPVLMRYGKRIRGKSRFSQETTG